MKKSRVLVHSAIVAALYAVMTMILPMASYGPIQFRFSEILTLTAFYNPSLIPGLTIGCLIANIPSPFGIADVIFGTLATFLAVYSMSKIKNIWLASLMPAIFNGIIIGTEITLLSDTSVNFFVVGGQVALSEFIIVTLIGVPVFKMLEKNKGFMKRLIDF